MARFFISAFIFATLVAAQAHAQTESMVVKRATELREAPSAISTSLATLAAQTPVNRLPTRLGAWIQVHTASGVTGWVHMFDVSATSTSSAPSNTATGALRGLSNFFNRGSTQANSTTTATSTVGIRGLTGEDIANAQPNLAALSQAEGLRMDAAQARRFAAEAALGAQAVEPLPVPPSPMAVVPKENTP